MKPWMEVDGVTVYHGDCITVMRELPADSVHAVVTDPPYGLEFMGKEWDRLDGTKWRNESEADQEWMASQKGERGINARRRNAPDYGKPDLAMQLWHQAWATEALRVLKPGGHLLAFGGTRTWHRLAVAVEDAGFEVRDSIAWMYGSGFPKSLDVSKAIDKAAGAQREVVGQVTTPYKVDLAEKRRNTYGSFDMLPTDERGYLVNNITAPATPAAQQWQGWGTALKPAFEPIVVARKPLIGTVAENVLAHGTGALNIDGCRIGTEGGGNACAGGDECHCVTSGVTYSPTKHPVRREGNFGRWPANVILDESQAAELDRQSGVITSAPAKIGKPSGTTFGGGEMRCEQAVLSYGDTIGASRFFYVPKANSSERPRAGEVAHPTVKPLDLMRYLVKLVTPPGGTVLEPFAGSGTTLEACIIEGFNVIGIELTDDYLPLIRQRIIKPIEPVLL